MVWAVIPTDLLSLMSINWGGGMLPVVAGQKHQLRRVACFGDWSSLYVNSNDIGSLGRHRQCLTMVGFVQHVMLCGFPEAPRCDGIQISLHQHGRQRHSRTLTTDQLPVEECLWYSIFLHVSKMSSPSELALDEQSFNAFYLVFGILSFQEMPQIFRRHLRWNWSSFFTWRRYQVQDSLPYKSMVSTTVLYTPIFVLRRIPWSDHSLWCNRPKMAQALLIREVISSSMQAFCERKPPK